MNTNNLDTLREWVFKICSRRPFGELDAQKDTDEVLNLIKQYHNTELEEIVKEIENSKCDTGKEPNNLGKVFTEEKVNSVIKYAGRFNYNKAIDDILTIIRNHKKDI